jgi:hypothetical protein
MKKKKERGVIYGTTIHVLTTILNTVIVLFIFFIFTAYLITYLKPDIIENPFWTIVWMCIATPLSAYIGCSQSIRFFKKKITLLSPNKVVIYSGTFFIFPTGILFGLLDWYALLYAIIWIIMTYRAFYDNSKKVRVTQSNT